MEHYEATGEGIWVLEKELMAVHGEVDAQV